MPFESKARRGMADADKLVAAGVVPLTFGGAVH